jgi:hypothetical protein
VSLASPPALKSYRKTTLACASIACAALGLACLAVLRLPTIASVVAAAVLFPVALGSATIAVAGVIVLRRCRMETLGKRDLFLHLNRSREADAIPGRGAGFRSPVRRWLARRVLGHDLLVGDTVEVKTWPEIRATLDDRGRLEHLPFMPEMLSMCGRRATVFRCMNRMFDYRKSRLMREVNAAVLLTGGACDGASHGGCEARCHTIWKSAWLRRIDEPHRRVPETTAPSYSAATAVDPLMPDRSGPPYVCQLTQLHDASRPIPNWSARHVLQPLVSGNVAPVAFVVGWLTHLFNEVQQLRGGVGYPALPEPAVEAVRVEDSPLVPGDVVVVLSSAEVRSTVDERSLHRGLYFEPDMMKHCGQLHTVQGEVTKLIDIVTGDMRVMRTPAYILRGVHFSGERQLFNSQWEPLFWRAAWLRRHRGT